MEKVISARETLSERKREKRTARMIERPASGEGKHCFIPGRREIEERRGEEIRTGLIKERG